MFVRRKVNKSGSISVHVVDKARGKYRVVKVFGPVESEQEVARLERQARTYIRPEEVLTCSLTKQTAALRTSYRPSATPKFRWRGRN